MQFIAHNIMLDNGVQTKPEVGYTMDQYPVLKAAKRILKLVFPGDKRRFRIDDIGCLEGGYAVEFARMGFEALGIEIRKGNFEACMYVKNNTDLPNLSFVQDDAWNVCRYGQFDVTFCSGLLYHFDKPKRFLQIISDITSKVLILNTHFAPMTLSEGKEGFALSNLIENEGVPGRWYYEFDPKLTVEQKEKLKLASWNNHQSFWICREYLIQLIRENGFDLVFEQYDSLGYDIAKSMIEGYYKTHHLGVFVGIKTGVV